MKIGIDASSLIQKKTGIGSFASGLFEELKAQAGRHELFFYGPAGGGEMNTPRRIYWESFELPARAERDGVDLVYSPGFSPPSRGRFKKVVTVHDLIGMIYPKNVGLVSGWYWSHWLPRNVRRADVRVASSESTRRDMERLLGIQAGDVPVVPLAANPIFSRSGGAADTGLSRRLSLEGPFIISVGTLEPRKNSLRLVEAFEKAAARFPQLKLVLVGKDGGLEQRLRSFISAHELADRVVLAGYLSDEDVIQLYRRATAYAMVSLYEGFGLPALEAMSCGLTGVISNVSSLPEVAGDTALSVPPEDTHAIAEALVSLAGDSAQRQRLAALALERSRQFSYKTVARRMLEIFERALA